jgi:hypothetical protein
MNRIHALPSYSTFILTSSLYALVYLVVPYLQVFLPELGMHFSLILATCPADLFLLEHFYDTVCYVVWLNCYKLTGIILAKLLSDTQQKQSV